jgi:hypothetical protein
MPVTTRLPRRAGDIKTAIHAVLASAEAPMRAVEVHQAVEQRLERPVNWQSVKGCLWEGWQADPQIFERVGRGRYQLCS